MMEALFALIVLALAAWVWRLHARNLRVRARLRSRPPPPIAPDFRVHPVRLECFDPVFRPGEWGPSRPVVMIGRGDMQVLGAPSDSEAWILCMLATEARGIFEFGTCTGRTAWMFARNAPAEATVTTLTLGPDQLAEYRAGSHDSERAAANALAESCHDRFYYTGTPEAAKIRQVFADSKTFDESPHRDRMDLVFVDGSHARSYVESDSQKAMRMVRPGGLVLWHDYRAPDVEETADVFRVLNELSERHPLVRLAATSLVAWRRPSSRTET